MSGVADMVEKMLAAGVAPEMIVLACRTVEVSANVRRLSADSADTRRARDRLAKQEKRAKLRALTISPEANDAGAVVNSSADMSADIADKRCHLSSLLTESQQGIQEVSKKETSKSTGVTRARGTRLSEDAAMSEADRQFAIKHGLDPISSWAEFVDYWIGIPGQRGTKLDWPATFRNRVREISTKNRGLNGKRPRVDRPSAAGDFFAGLRSLATDIDRDGDVARTADPDIPRGRVEIDG